jgi:peptidylprolyl isomerase
MHTRVISSAAKVVVRALGGAFSWITPPHYGWSTLAGMSALRAISILAMTSLLLAACDSGSDAAACEEGRVTTDSGLQYEETECGDGEEAGRGDVVNVRYTGTLENGEVFDSGTYAFQVGGGEVIAGWDEGIAGMKVGGKRQLIIPPDLGYGPQGNPPVIPPNATLLFDVELLEIRSS